MSTTTATQFTGSTLTVTPLNLTLSGVAAKNKAYDATTTASLDTSTAVLVGLVSGDDVNLDTSHDTVTFNTKDVGTGKPVSVAGMALTGASAGDYTLTQPTGLTAAITPATLTASLIGVVAKTYDGSVTAAVSPQANYALTGVLGSDQVGLNDPAAGTYNSKDAGLSKAVSVAGLTLIGADAADYALA